MLWRLYFLYLQIIFKDGARKFDLCYWQYFCCILALDFLFYYYSTVISFNLYLFQFFILLDILLLNFYNFFTKWASYLIYFILWMFIKYLLIFIIIYILNLLIIKFYLLILKIFICFEHIFCNSNIIIIKW